MYARGRDPVGSLAADRGADREYERASMESIDAMPPGGGIWEHSISPSRHASYAPWGDQGTGENKVSNGALHLTYPHLRYPFSKVTLCSTYTRALTFENLFQGRPASTRALHPTSDHQPWILLHFITSSGCCSEAAVVISSNRKVPSRHMCPGKESGHARRRGRTKKRNAVQRLETTHSPENTFCKDTLVKARNALQRECRCTKRS